MQEEQEEETHAMLLQGNQGYYHGAPRQVLLDDITVVIDVALIAAFCVAVQLLRRRAISIATLAHLLSVPFLVVVLGHSIERHVLGVDRVGDLVRRRPGRGGVADWSTAGILSTAVVAALVARFWNCRGVGVDCVVGNAAPIHYRCKVMRLRFFFPVFAATIVFIYVCISARLNALLGGSVLHPEGGSYALAVLASPTLVSALFVSTSVSVWLYSILVDAQGTSCLALQSRGADGITGGKRCSLTRAKCPGGGISNAWQAGNSSSSSSSSSSGNSGGRGGKGGLRVGSSRGVERTSFRAGGTGAGKFAGDDTAGPAHALDPPFFPLSPYNLNGKEAERPSSSLVQAARGGLPIQRLDASDITDPARDPARGAALGEAGVAVRGATGSAKWLPPHGRKTGNRADPQLATASIGEGLLQAASENNDRESDRYSPWGDVSSLGETETCRSARGLTTATRYLPLDSPNLRPGLGPAGASRFSLGGVASAARDSAATAGTALLPVPPAKTPRGRNGFLDGQAWREGEVGGVGRQQWRQQRRRRLREGGEGSGSRAMTGSANGWTSSSSSSSSSDPGSSDEDFAGSGGGGRGTGSGGGGILIRRLSGLSGSLSAVPSTRLSLGAPSYASSGGEGGGNLVVPPFPSSEFPIDGGGASPSRDRKGLRSFDRGLRSREVLPYSPMGEPQSSVASLTSRSSSSSGSVSRSSDGHCSRDRGGRRGGGGGWGWAGDRGATSGNRLGSGESPQEKGATMTTACSATMGSVRGGGSGGGGNGGGDWGSAFAGDLEREAGGSATRLRRREGWIV